VKLPYRDFSFLEKPDQYESCLDVFGRILGPEEQVISEFSRQEMVVVPGIS